MACSLSAKSRVPLALETVHLGQVFAAMYDVLEICKASLTTQFVIELSQLTTVLKVTKGLHANTTFYDLAREVLVVG